MSRKDVEDAAEMLNSLTLNPRAVDDAAEAPLAETPEALNVELMPHQRRALKWMAKRETLPEFGSGIYTGQGHSCRGGILADDQGLGKTLTTISLCFHNGIEGKPWRNLIVCPVSLVSQWKKEIESRVKPNFKKRIYLYHGPNRSKHAHDLKMYDFVITTYQTLANEYPKSFKAAPTRKAGAAFNLTWNRVILDEAHNVKNRGTDSWKAVAALNATCRWCLTGTPIQNSVDDMFALLMFIRYNFVPDVEEWNKRWKRPMMEKGDKSVSPQERARVFKRFQAVLEIVLLRRTKNDKINGQPLVILPEREVIILEERLQGEEEAFYKSVEDKANQVFKELYRKGLIATNYLNILTLLLRKRQAACHPSLIKYCDMQKRGETANGETIMDIIRSVDIISDSSDEETEDELPNSDDGDFIDDRSEDEIWEDRFTKKKDDDVQPVNDASGTTHNRNKKSKPIVISDSDDDTSEDEDEVIEVKSNSDSESDDDSLLALPLMSKKVLGLANDANHNGVVDLTGEDDPSGEAENVEENVVKKKGKKEVAREMRDEVMVPSRKIAVLLSKLKETREEEPEQKSLIFSQWTSCMDIISCHLEKEGFGYCRLDGTMRIPQRNKAIESFKNDPKKVVFLISLMAGGTGLNLTCASQVFLFDVWWNPSAEEQAIDRAHRIGQTRRVRVFRFKMLGTVEEDLYKVCESKKEMTSGALGGKSQDNQKLSGHHLRMLFNLDNDTDDSVSVRETSGKRKLLKPSPPPPGDLIELGKKKFWESKGK